MMKNKLLILAYVTSILARLIPYLITSTPFSIDSLPIIKDVYILYSNQGLSLDSNQLDGYNNYWPGSILASLIFTYIIGLDPITSTALLIPLSNGLAVIILSVIIKRLGGDNITRFLILFILGIIFPYSFFYAGVTKETYGISIFLTIILVVIFHKNWDGTVILPLLISSLVITHHLTSFLLLIITVFLSLYILKNNTSKLDKSFPLYGLSLITGFAYIQYEFMGSRGLTLPVYSIDVILELISFIIFFLFIGYFTIKDRNIHLKRAFYNSVILCIIIGLLAYYILTYGFIPGQPKYDIKYFIISLSYVSLIPLSLIGKEYLKNGNGEWVTLWLLGLLSMLSYSVLSFNTFFNSLSYRILDFFILPFIITSGFTLKGIRRTKRWKEIIIYGLLALLLIQNLLIWNEIYLNHDEYLGYNWFLPSRIQHIKNWIYNIDNVEIYGDTNINIIMRNMFNLTCNPLYNNLKNEKRWSGLAIIYREMYEYGYNFGSIIYEKIDLKNLVNTHNLVFQDGESEAYWGY